MFLIPHGGPGFHIRNAGLLGTFRIRNSDWGCKLWPCPLVRQRTTWVSVWLYLETDALGQGQVLAVVDRVSRAAHVGLPGVGTRFPAASGILLSAEGAANFSAGGSDVYVGNPAIGTRRRDEPFGLARSFVNMAELRPCRTPFCSSMASSMSPVAHHIQDWGECLFAHDVEIAGNLHNRGADVEAAVLALPPVTRSPPHTRLASLTLSLCRARTRIFSHARSSINGPTSTPGCRGSPIVRRL